MGKQKYIDSTMGGLDFALKYRILNPEQKSIVKTKMNEAINAQKEKSK